MGNMQGVEMSQPAKVLIVDDEELIRLNLRALLEDLGYRVTEAAEGREGLDAFDRERPDLVLADLMMPVMDGLSMIAGLREKSRETPVIVISGTGAVRDAVDALRLGAWDYVIKPVADAEGLDIIVKRALEKARLVRENRLYREHLEELVRERTEELRESEARYRRLLESVTSYVYTVTFKDGLPDETVHGPGCEAVTGFTLEEHAADPYLWRRMVHDDDRPLVADMARHILEGSSSVSLEYRICHKDGAVRWVRNTLVPHRTASGELLSYDGVVVDITERREAEEKQRRTNEMLHAVIEAAPTAIIGLDLDGNVQNLWNPAAEKMLGWSAREIMGRPLPSVRMENREEFRHFRELLRSGKTLDSVEVRRQRRDGTPIDYSIYASPLRDAEGLITGKIAVLVDLTERKRAEQAVEESRNFLDKIINSITDPILVKDRQHRWVLLNDACCDFVGYSRDELLGKSNYDFFPKKEADVFWSKDEIVFTSGMENINEEELTDEKGVVHTISTKKTLYTNERGEKFIVGIIRDITERKHAETRLNDQLHFLQQLLDSIPIPVYYKDTDGLYLGCNSAFETFIGLSRNDIVGKTVYELTPKDRADKHHEADSALLCHPGVQIYEASGMYNDGECHNVIFNKATFVDANNCVAGTVGALMDITSLRKAEDERKKLEAQLYQAQKMEAIGQFAGGIAHDFNNILTAINGYAEIILMRLEKDSPLRHFIEQILTSAERAADLTHGLLAFSRRQVLDTKPIDLCGVVRGLKKMLGRLVPEDIDLRTTVVERDLIVMADKGQIEQVLMNLVTNAKDAMPRGGSLTIEVSAAVIDERFVLAQGFGEPGNYACISVTDTGHGMDEDTKQRIFEPFFTTKEVGKGTGLGMAIVYGIIQQHNGHITVYSETGRGTTFKIYLPLIVEEIKEMHEARDAEPPPGGTETILLAEDDVTVRELHGMILEKAGYKIVEAVDGEDALDKFMERQAEVDILATDVIMPKIDGKSLYEEIRKIRPDMKVLFMSGYTKDIIVERGILDDEFSYITKPVKSFELLKLVRDILDRNRFE
jgi:two-component system cell cycle sensor histidine kinase/response regulator CckA